MNERKLIAGAAITAVILILLAGYIVSEQNNIPDITGKYILTEGQFALLDGNEVTFYDEEEVIFEIASFDGHRAVGYWNGTFCAGVYDRGYLTFTSTYSIPGLGTMLEDVGGYVQDNKLYLGSLSKSDTGITIATGYILVKEGTDPTLPEREEKLSVGDVFESFASDVAFDGMTGDAKIDSYTISVTDFQCGMFVLEHRLSMNDGQYTEAYKTVAMRYSENSYMSGIESSGEIAYIHVDGKHLTIEYNYQVEGTHITCTHYMSCDGNTFDKPYVSMISGLVYRGQSYTLTSEKKEYNMEVSMSFGNAVGNAYPVYETEGPYEFTEYIQLMPNKGGDGYQINTIYRGSNVIGDYKAMATGWLSGDLKTMNIKFAVLYSNGIYESALYLMTLSDEPSILGTYTMKSGSMGMLIDGEYFLYDAPNATVLTIDFFDGALLKATIDGDVYVGTYTDGYVTLSSSYNLDGADGTFNESASCYLKDGILHYSSLAYNETSDMTGAVQMIFAKEGATVKETAIDPAIKVGSVFNTFEYEVQTADGYKKLKGNPYTMTVTDYSRGVYVLDHTITIGGTMNEYRTLAVQDGEFTLFFGCDSVTGLSDIYTDGRNAIVLYNFGSGDDKVLGTYRMSLGDEYKESDAKDVSGLVYAGTLSIVSNTGHVQEKEFSIMFGDMAGTMCQYVMLVDGKTYTDTMQLIAIPDGSYEIVSGYTYDDGSMTKGNMYGTISSDLSVMTMVSETFCPNGSTWASTATLVLNSIDDPGVSGPIE